MKGLRMIAPRSASLAPTAIRAVLCFGLAALASCTPEGAGPPPPGRHRMTQVSVINALMLGHYDGVMPIPELLRHGDFGVGTLDHLDGELIVLDGRAYQVRGDGAVLDVGPERSTPFASVTRFEKDGEFPCPPLDSLRDLDAKMDHDLPQANHFVAIRAEGRFASITLRSVHGQQPPYRPLVDVAKDQSVWTHGDVAGTLIGVRSPAWVGGINVPGYHWHFLSDDRKVGGHVLDCRLREARVQYEVCSDWLVKLDDSSGLDGAALGQDLRRDLRKVEGARGAEQPEDKTGR